MKKLEGRVCQECLSLIYETNELNWLFHPNGLQHYSLICNNCLNKKDYPSDLIFPMNKYKAGKNFIEGKPTAKGNSRYYFIDEKGKTILLTSESGLKRNLKPATKKNL